MSQIPPPRRRDGDPPDVVPPPRRAGDDAAHRDTGPQAPAPTAPAAAAAHYVSFEDRDEDRTWMFDASFLTSSWRCIFGDGCPGVLTAPAPELEQGCCSYGAHIVDADDAAAVTSAADRLTDAQWQNRRVALRRGGPLRQAPGGGLMTRMVGDVCIFFNQPDFPGGTGCALHRAALDAGERPMDWKPDVCWQLPLRLVEHTEESGHVVSILRRWTRRDWGAGGQEFHWWCTERPATGEANAFDGHRPVYLELREELIELVGTWAYERLVELLESEPPEQRAGTDLFGGQPVVLASRRSARATDRAR